jgi:hypothetical protein
VLTIGAGDITNLGQELLARLRKQTPDGGGVDELVRPA